MKIKFSIFKFLQSLSRRHIIDDKLIEKYSLSSYDNVARVEEIVRETKKVFPTESVDDEKIYCYECKAKEGDHHQVGCHTGLCPNTRSDGSCTNPMKLLRRDEAPLSWKVPAIPERRRIFFVRLPSQCDECGATTPMFPGAQ